MKRVRRGVSSTSSLKGKETEPQRGSSGSPGSVASVIPDLC